MQIAQQAKAWGAVLRVILGFVQMVGAATALLSFAEAGPTRLTWVAATVTFSATALSLALFMKKDCEPETRS